MANRRYSQATAEPLAGNPAAAAGSVTPGVPWEESRPGDLLALDRKTRGEIENICKKAVTSWLSSSSTHHANLTRWNDLLEGVMEETNFPWEGASNLHVPLIAIHVVTLHSVMARSLLTVDPLWTMRTLDTAIRERAADIEEAINYQAKSELNVVQACRDVLYTTPRDGLGWLWGAWALETSPVEDVFRAASVDQFIAEYPDAESAKMDEADYEDTKRIISEEASQESPYELRVECDRVDYRGPKFEVVDEADFVRAPMTASTLNKCRVYGRHVWERAETLKEEADDEKLWPAAVEAWAAAGKTKSKDDRWRRSLEAIEGITDDESGFSDERDIYRLVVRYKKPGEKRERKLLCTYSQETKKCLGVAKYPYTRNCAIPFRIIRRPGRMIGKSVPEQLEDMNAAVDASINYEENSDTLQMAPVFKGKRALTNRDSDFDPALEENWIRPGATLWLETPDDFQSMQIQGTDKTAAKARRQEIIRYAEMVIGPTQLLSGQESQVDPSAPGNKTIALIQQSNMRCEDYLNEFRLGFDELGDFIKALYHQFGGLTLDYADKQGNVKSLERELLKDTGKMAAHGVTVNLSPEVEFQKAMQWWAILKDEPMVGGDPVRRRELLSELMVSGRLPNREALLPTKEDVMKPPPPPQKPPPPPPKTSINLKADVPPAIAIQLAETGEVTAPPPPPVPGPGGPGAGLPGPGGPAPQLPPALLASLLHAKQLVGAPGA